jgi:hypothetical protein
MEAVFRRRPISSTFADDIPSLAFPSFLRPTSGLGSLHLLIDNMIIRIRPKSFAISTTSISNRQYLGGSTKLSITGIRVCSTGLVITHHCSTRNTPRPEFSVTDCKQTPVQFLPETPYACSSFSPHPRRLGALRSQLSTCFEPLTSDLELLIVNMIIRIALKSFALSADFISNRQYSRASRPGSPTRPGVAWRGGRLLSISTPTSHESQVTSHGSMRQSPHRNSTPEVAL